MTASLSNPFLRDLRRAMTRGALTRDGWCAAEGPHLFEEALRTGRLRAVVATEPPPSVPGVRSIRVTRAVFRALSDTETPQGILSLVEPRAWTWDDLTGPVPALVLALDGVQDPGNTGTLLRAAEAFGASGAVLLKGTASAWNPKTVRASAGSIFRLPTLAGWEADAFSAACRAAGVAIYAALPEAGQEPAHADLRRACAIVIGSESRGVSEAVRREARPVRIPTAGVESLNAAVAGAILLYEAARQRGRSA